MPHGACDVTWSRVTKSPRRVSRSPNPLRLTALPSCVEAVWTLSVGLGHRKAQEAPGSGHGAAVSVLTLPPRFLPPPRPSPPLPSGSLPLANLPQRGCAFSQLPQ